MGKKSRKKNANKSSNDDANNVALNVRTAFVFSTKNIGVDSIQFGFVFVEVEKWRNISQGLFLIQLSDNEGKENSNLFLIEKYCKKADIIVAHDLELNSNVMNAVFYRQNHINGYGYFSNLIVDKQQVCTMKECGALMKLKNMKAKMKETDRAA